MKLFLKNLSLVAIAAIASLPMSAVPTLRVSTNGTDWTTAGTGFTVTDNSGSDLDGTTGVISLVNNVSLAGWTITVDTGKTKNAQGTAWQPELITSAIVSRTSNTAASLFFEFFETGFLGSDLSTSTLSASANGLLAGGINNGVFKANINDGSFLTTGTLGFSGFSSASTNINGGTIVPLTPYKLTLATTLNVAGLSTVALNSSFTGVPEPGFYGLLSIGLSGLFAAVARRRAAVKE